MNQCMKQRAPFEWLNPEIELPPDDKVVLLACRHNGCSSGCYYDLGWYDFYQQIWRCAASDTGDVVLYWAFLPDFPKEDPVR